MEIVINKCYGGFSLSNGALRYYAKLKGYTPIEPLNGFRVQTEEGKEFYDQDIERNDPILVKIVKEMGEGANGSFAELAVVKIPNNVKWQIDEYDGIEWVAEQHRTWS